MPSSKRGLAAPYAQGLGYWSIFERSAPAEFIGWVLLIPVDAMGPDIEIGWRLRPKFWRRGLATEAARPVLAHGLATLGLAAIVAEIDSDNVGSRRVAEKLGMQLQPTIRAASGRSIERYVISPKETFSPATP